jgi:hypothetical protein
MNWSKRLRIVPQLLACVAGLLHTGLAGALDAPALPANVVQAEAFLADKLAIEAKGDEALKARKADCYQQTLISNCIRAVDQEATRFRRDVRAAEVAAKELLRLEKLRIDQEKRQSRESPKLDAISTESPPTGASSPAAPPTAAPAPPTAALPATTDTTPAPGKAKPLRQPAPQVPSVTPKEQAENRERYEQKQRDAHLRQENNRQRIQDLEEKRARYQEDQQRRQQQLQERAARSEAQNRDKTP